MWPKRYPHCANCGCGPERRAYGSRGYCGRCFYASSRIEWVKKYGRQNPKTPKDVLILSTDKKLKSGQKKFIRQANSRLRYYRAREEMRSGRLPVGPLDVERKLASVLRACSGVQFLQVANYVGKHTNQNERCVLYGLLDDLEERLPAHRFMPDLSTYAMYYND
jgi:hypothetical protein